MVRRQMAVSILINHHGRPLVAVTRAAGWQQSKATIERGLARLDIEFFSIAA